MKLIASRVCKKPSLDVAEDLVGWSNGFYWLLDGATPPMGVGTHELTFRYVQTLSRGLSMYAETAEDPEELLWKALGYVRGVFSGCVEHFEFLPSSTVVIVQALESELRYLVLGDSFLCVYADDGVVLLETDDRLKSIATEERQRVRDLRAAGVSEDDLAYLEARKALVCAEMKYRNKVDGYWIAELDPQAAKEARKGTVRFEGVGKFYALAATDGMERLVSVFGAYPSLRAVGEAILRRGDEAIFEQLRALEKDPGRAGRTTSSQHDDASVFLLST